MIIDRRPKKVATPRDGPRADRLGGRVAAGGWEDVAAADVLVICAADGADREHRRATSTSPRTRAIVDGIAERLDGFGGAAIMVTNPVDPLTARLARVLGRDRVLGYTFNDTLRLRRGAARATTTCGCWASTATARCRSSAACVPPAGR